MAFNFHTPARPHRRMGLYGDLFGRSEPGIGSRCTEGYYWVVFWGIWAPLLNFPIRFFSWTDTYSAMLGVFNIRKTI